MNWVEFKNIFNDFEIIEDKLVLKSDIVRALRFIKDNYHFELLKNITAIDYQEKGVELIYNLYSIQDEETLLVAILVEKETESVSKIFDSATADEKEIYDLFGINFIGNDELKRLYMAESWKGHPLKKDYIENDERLNWND